MKANEEELSEAAVEAEIVENANQEFIDVDCEPVEDVSEEKPTEKPQEQPQEQKQEQKQKRAAVTMEDLGF